MTKPSQRYSSELRLKSNNDKHTERLSRTAKTQDNPTKPPQIRNYPKVTKKSSTWAQRDAKQSPQRWKRRVITTKWDVVIEKSCEEKRNEKLSWERRVTCLTGTQLSSNHSRDRQRETSLKTLRGKNYLKKNKKQKQMQKSPKFMLNGPKRW